ncbi:FkbM family methyltransferase [Iningainema tapete]|uniref:FkbM family methyltransferase n=1 Tax=Iningainema tapete BLCC-T55 TaxID=2748662 RepID=A0A8J6XL13_9CYAN|nr:FkbM family methyltransferase [Iningainema tapete]MBD2772387.1 FkbM family methyltransferase [Iningainema tapete BLCC-T55]
MYAEQALIPFYQKILRFTKGRGEHTLAKVDAFLFRSVRQVTINRDDDISIVLPPDPHFFRYLIKSHEQHISYAISKLVKNGDIFIDVGANIGYFSAYATAAVGKQGKVFCLEPESKNFEYLKTNCNTIQKRGFDCSAYSLAASSVNGEATLSIHRYSTYHTIEDNYLERVEDKQIINTVTLDDWTKQEGIEHISLLKIDTEGHEPRVLEGARKLFHKKAVDFVILECRSEQIASFIDDFCQEFNLHQLTWDGHTWHQTGARSIKYRTECLLSKVPLSPNLLC